MPPGGTAKVRQSGVEKLETGQRLFAALEQRRIEALRTQAGTLAESAVLKAVLDTYRAERRTAPPAVREQLVATVARALDTLARHLEPDVLVARDVDGDVLSFSGRHAAAWTAEYPHNEHAPTDASILTLRPSHRHAVRLAHGDDPNAKVRSPGSAHSQWRQNFRAAPVRTSIRRPFRRLPRCCPDAIYGSHRPTASTKLSRRSCCAEDCSQTSSQAGRRAGRVRLRRPGRVTRGQHWVRPVSIAAVMVAAAGPSADAQGHAGRVALEGIGPIDVRRSSAALKPSLHTV